MNIIFRCPKSLSYQLSCKNPIKNNLKTRLFSLLIESLILALTIWTIKYFRIEKVDNAFVFLYDINTKT